jgi:uncharacterized Tic20 family protein
MIKFLFYLFLSMILIGAGVTVADNGMVGFIGLITFCVGMLSLLLLIHWDLEKNNL